MTMKQWLKNTWHDPVWSKVISGIILFALGVLSSLVKGWLSNTETISEAFQSVFTYKINIWIAIAIVLAVMIVVGVVKRYRNESSRIPAPPFVNDFIAGMYQGQRWQWRWQWSKTFKYYYIADLSIVCPACKQGLLTLGIMDYKCGKCGADIPYKWLNTTHDAVEKQVLEDARKQYHYCDEYIGKMPQPIGRG